MSSSNVNSALLEVDYGLGHLDQVPLPFYCKRKNHKYSIEHSKKDKHFPTEKNLLIVDIKCCKTRTENRFAIFLIEGKKHIGDINLDRKGINNQYLHRLEILRGASEDQMRTIAYSCHVLVVGRMLKPAYFAPVVALEFLASHTRLIFFGRKNTNNTIGNTELQRIHNEIIERKNREIEKLVKQVDELNEIILQKCEDLESKEEELGQARKNVEQLQDEIETLKSDITKHKQDLMEIISMIEEEEISPT